MNKYHLTFKDSKWKLKPEGASRAVKVFEKKRDAIKGSAEYLRSREGSLRIHKKDGTIQEERRYGTVSLRPPTRSEVAAAILSAELLHYRPL